jgi:oxalate decarboxylase/phosphoglucose isomerase-like protein (cupin superfamily)
LCLTALNARALITSKVRAISLRGTSSQDAPILGRHSKKIDYSEKLSKHEFKTFPGGGGQIKPLDPTHITGNTMGFAYLELFTGGVRELHWHPLSAEWAYVLEGSCAFNVMNNDGQYTNGVAHAGDV